LLRSKAEAYNKHVADFKAGGWEQDQVLLRKKGIKIIGMTTTGLSKYRALVTALRPKIVFIEEAAETMEAPVISACVPTLEHLVLVGDHKQLRPQCAVRDLERHPFNLNVSLFERMVSPDNDVEYSMLKKQRRMIPEIRRLLKPIYGSSITDHESMRDVEVRPPVPGMGGINSFFYTHYFPETNDEQMSSTNQLEADMVVGFFDHLLHNGLKENQITVLTFYDGQRKLILRKLREHRNLINRVFKVVTVDSYQGEENEIVILSLVRSNDDGKIGFLGVENRVCVALSRAKRGFYIFGNGELLAGESKVWSKAITIMADRGKLCEPPPSEPKCRVLFNVPTTCTNHGRKTFISGPEDWDVLYGGCKKKCETTLACGHICPLNCHPFDHDCILCPKPCILNLPCGHPCSSTCSQPCKCDRCKRNDTNRAISPAPESDNQTDFQRRSNLKTWTAYAGGDVKKHDLALYQMMLKLDRAAEAGHKRDELRDRYLQEQVANASFPTLDSELQLTGPNAAVTAAPQLSILNQVTKSIGPYQNLALSYGETKTRHLFEDAFSITNGALPYAGFKNATVTKRVNIAPGGNTTEGTIVPDTHESDLLIDLS
jgi:helicase required for RNAi-mediated heterochromatin assembly 1